MVRKRYSHLVDDVLLLVEAKAGAAATIASPALDFGRHAQSVQDLVLKAYKQCARFFNYMNSADEVSLYHLVNGKYEECCRVRRSDYRVMVPIGLTVESFSPFPRTVKNYRRLSLYLESMLSFHCPSTICLCSSDSCPHPGSSSITWRCGKPWPEYAGSSL